MVTYFTKDAAIHANKLATAAYSQEHVVQQEANLDYILSRVEAYAEDSKNEDEKVIRKAAYLLRYIAYQGHIFTDGNKRTAFALARAFLELNGYTMPAGGEESQEGRARMMREIAEGRHSLSRVLKWLEKSVERKI
ncbi:MAG: Fic family protein [Candidatus Micrarchaeota archaeon]|nr:Fic family protein [Candidatus Micrarchaeota archaeon]